MCRESRLKVIHYATTSGKQSFLCSSRTIITEKQTFRTQSKVDIMLYNHLKSYMELYENKFHMKKLLISLFLSL